MGSVADGIHRLWSNALFGSPEDRARWEEERRLWQRRHRFDRLWAGAGAGLVGALGIGAVIGMSVFWSMAVSHDTAVVMSFLTGILSGPGLLGACWATFDKIEHRLNG